MSRGSYLRFRKLFVAMGIFLILIAGVLVKFGPSALAVHAGSQSANNVTCQHWNVTTSPNKGTGQNVLNAVANVPNSSNVWAVGDYTDSTSGFNQTLIELLNGTSWSIASSPNMAGANNYLTSVAALSATNAWAVGYTFANGSVLQTLVEHWNGSAWSIVSSPNPDPTTDQLFGVAVISANNVWAVGNTFDGSVGLRRTLIEHWDGATWNVVSSPNANTGT